MGRVVAGLNCLRCPLRVLQAVHPARWVELLAVLALLRPGPPRRRPMSERLTRLGALLGERYGDLGRAGPAGAGALALGRGSPRPPRGAGTSPRVRPPAAAVRRLLAGAPVRHRRPARAGGLRRQPSEPRHRGPDHPGALRLPAPALPRTVRPVGGGGQRRAGVPGHRRDLPFPGSPTTRCWGCPRAGWPGWPARSTPATGSPPTWPTPATSRPALSTPGALVRASACAEGGGGREPLRLPQPPRRQRGEGVRRVRQPAGGARGPAAAGHHGRRHRASSPCPSPTRWQRDGCKRMPATLHAALRARLRRSLRQLLPPARATSRWSTRPCAGWG